MMATIYFCFKQTRKSNSQQVAVKPTILLFYMKIRVRIEQAYDYVSLLKTRNIKICFDHKARRNALSTTTEINDQCNLNCVLVKLFPSMLIIDGPRGGSKGVSGIGRAGTLVPSMILEKQTKEER